MKVLITGSSGYIGSRLVSYLSFKGHDPVCYDYTDRRNILDKFDLMDTSYDVDCIVHLAGVVGIGAVSNNSESESINIQGTKNVIDTGKRVIFSSVLGKSADRIVTEESDMIPTNEYFKQKIAAEYMVRKGKDNTVLRFGTLFGVSDKMRWDLLVHNLSFDIVNKGCIEIYDADSVRPITFINDAVSAIVKAVEDPSSMAGIFNIVTENMSKKDIVDTLCKIVDKKREGTVKVETVESRELEHRDYYASHIKMLKAGIFPWLNDTTSISSEFRKILCEARKEVYKD